MKNRARQVTADLGRDHTVEPACRGGQGEGKSERAWKVHYRRAGRGAPCAQWRVAAVTSERGGRRKTAGRTEIGCRMRAARGGRHPVVRSCLGQMGDVALARIASRFPPTFSRPHAVSCRTAARISAPLVIGWPLQCAHVLEVSPSIRMEVLHCNAVPRPASRITGGDGAAGRLMGRFRGGLFPGHHFLAFLEFPAFLP